MDRLCFFLFYLLITIKNIHNTTKFTPSEARKSINQLAVKLNMEMKAKRGRKYPEINVGDNVKNFRKNN